MFCPKCGNQLPDNAKFCGKCGADVNSYLGKRESSNNKTNSKLNEKNKNIYNDNVNNEFPNNSSKDKKQKHISKKTIIVVSIIIGALLVVALIVFIVYIVVINPKNNYDKLVSEYKSAYTQALNQKNDLQKKIGGAEYTLNNISKDSVEDSSLFNKLGDELSNAKTSYNACEILDLNPDSDEELRYGIDKFNENKESLKNQWWNLNNAEMAIYRSRDAKIDDGCKLVDRLTTSNKDTQGYEIETKLKTTSWIKASNTSQINKAWTSAGGRNSAPDISTFNSSSGYNDYSKDTCCVLIGSAEFHNKTSNFHISKTNKKNPAVYLRIFDPSINDYTTHSPYSNCSYQFKWKVNYWTYTNPNDRSSAIKDETRSGFLSFNNNYAYTDGGINADKLVDAEMTEDSWGPIAFMIVMHDEFSPNYPNGNPLIDNLHVAILPSTVYGAKNSYYLDKSFLPGKTW